MAHYEYVRVDGRNKTKRELFSLWRVKGNKPGRNDFTKVNETYFMKKCWNAVCTDTHQPHTAIIYQMQIMVTSDIKLIKHNPRFHLTHPKKNRVRKRKFIECHGGAYTAITWVPCSLVISLISVNSCQPLFMDNFLIILRFILRYIDRCYSQWKFFMWQLVILMSITRAICGLDKVTECLSGAQYHYPARLRHWHRRL